MEVSVYNILKGSQNAIFHDDGLAVYQEVEPFVKREEETFVSFDNIQICTTQFLNALFGKLLMNFGEEKVKKLVHPQNHQGIHSFTDKFNLVFNNFEEKNRGAIEEAYA